MSCVFCSKRCRWLRQVQSVTNRRRVWLQWRSTSFSCFRGQRFSKAAVEAPAAQEEIRFLLVRPRARWSPTITTPKSSRLRSNASSAPSGTCQTTTRTTRWSAWTSPTAEGSPPPASTVPPGPRSATSSRRYTAPERPWTDYSRLGLPGPQQRNTEFSARSVCRYVLASFLVTKKISL